MLNYSIHLYFHGNQWTIEVEYGHLVEITFTDYDFESSENCELDGLIVRHFYIQKS